MYHISSLVRRIITNCQTYYIPQQELTIDECMIPFYGRHSWKVWMKNKPIRYGFKAYMLVEAKTSYVLNWTIHTGDKRDTIYNEELATLGIVKKLIEPYSGENYNLYMDRFYSGLKVFKYLTINEIGACGTILMNRLNFPSGWCSTIDNMMEGRSQFYKLGNEMLLSAWNDKRLVMILSTIHETNRVQYERYNEEAINKKETVSCPASVADYRKHMGGVDKLDKHLGNYQFFYRNSRWYIRIFTHFLEIAILNAYVLYSQTCVKSHITPLSRYEFHLQLARELVQPWRKANKIALTPAKSSKRKPEVSLAKLLAEVIPKPCIQVKLPEGTKLRCSICDMEGKARTYCTFCCETCDEAVHQKCFNKHENIRYIKFQTQ